jgi:translation elongation factor P/translation initiation factor 5A
MDFQFDIQNVEASQLKTGDYIMYGGRTIQVTENKIFDGHMKCSIKTIHVGLFNINVTRTFSFLKKFL